MLLPSFGVTSFCCRENHPNVLEKRVNLFDSSVFVQQMLSMHLENASACDCLHFISVPISASGSQDSQSLVKLVKSSQGKSANLRCNFGINLGSLDWRWRRLLPWFRAARLSLQFRYCVLAELRADRLRVDCLWIAGVSGIVGDCAVRFYVSPGDALLPVHLITINKELIR